MQELDAWALTSILARWVVYASALLAAGTVLFLAGQPGLARRHAPDGGARRPARGVGATLAVVLAGLAALLWPPLHARRSSVGALLVTGAAAFVAGRLSPAPAAVSSPVPAALGATVRTALLAALVAALVTPLGIALQAGQLLDDGWRGMLDPEMLALAGAGPGGTAALVRLAGLALVLTLHRDGPSVASIGGALLVVASFAFSGHATDAPRLAAPVLLGAHLTAAGFWIGALHPLHRLSGQRATLAAAAAAAERFGQQAVGVIAMLVVVGTAYASLLVGSPSALLGSVYGRTLLLKIALVAALLGLAALNRTRLAPRLAGAPPWRRARRSPCAARSGWRSRCSSRSCWRRRC